MWNVCSKCMPIRQESAHENATEADISYNTGLCHVHKVGTAFGMKIELTHGNITKECLHLQEVCGDGALP